MAEPRVFTLIGNFTDNITPSLQKINESLAKVKANLESVSKATKPLKTDFRQLASLSDNFAKGLKTQASDIRDVTKAMRAMRNEMGRVNRAYKAGGRNITQDARRFSAPPPPPPRPPGGGRSGYGGRGGGYGGGYGGFQPQPSRRSYATEVGAGTFGVTLGSQLGSVVENAIISGFRIGTDLMALPFRKFASAFGASVQDELQDLQAAGGLFAISKRQKDPFLKSFQEAVDYQQETNEVFAKMAAALPGVTSEYVQVGKRISDTVARVVTKDVAGAIKMANEIRATQEGKQFYGEQITGGGAKAQRDAITTIIGDLTRTTVLAGQGGRGGAGGMAGAYGLPGLTERMISQDQVSTGQFQRYAAVFSNPMILDALQRNVDAINATAKDSVERVQAMRSFYAEIVTPELVDALRNSFDGVYQSMRSAFIDPDSGLFGMRRQLDNFGKKMNIFGEYIDDTGEVVTDVNRAANENLSLYEMIRDVFARTGVVLAPIIDNIKLLWDPMRIIAEQLKDARHYAGEFQRTFNEYREGLLQFSEASGIKLENIDFRASLAAVNNLLAEFGAVTDAEFMAIGQMLKDPKANLGSILKDLVSKFFKSDIAENIGEAVGSIVGTVLSEIAGVGKQLTDVAEASGLVKGLRDGFEKAGGTQAIKDIIGMVFSTIGKLIITVVTAAPFQSAMIAGLFMLPSIIAGTISGAVTAVFTGGLPKLKEAFLRMVSNLLKVKTVTVKDLGNTTPITDPRRMLPAAKGPSGPLAIINKGLSTFGNAIRSIGNYLKGIGPRFTSFFKGFLGKLSIFGAVITSVISLFQGKDLARSLAEGAGPLLGAALGAALIPFLGPIGPMIGAAIGGTIGTGEAIVRPLEETFRAIGSTLGPIMEGLGASLQSVVNIVGSVVMGVVGAFVPLEGEIDDATAMIIAIKVALTPVVAAFQLVEQVVNLLAIGLKGLELAVLYARRGLAQLNPFGDEEKKRRLEQEIGLREEELNQANGRVISAFKRHQEWYKTDTAAKPIAASSVPSAQPGKRVSALTPTSADMAWYNQQRSANKPRPQSGKQVSGLKPTAADMSWYNQQISKKPASGPTVTPPKPTAPVSPAPAANPAAVAAQAQAVTATATNTQQLNQKAVTQITHAAETKSAAVKTQANTTTANTTLGNIRAGIMAVSNKLSSLQSAILGDLNNIQAGVSRISSLLASGSLKVQADFNVGGGLGGGKGGPPVFGAAASKFGLEMTSGYRPGDPGYHGLNRARDYSNGSGPTPQMQMFAQFMAGTFGKNLKELIYTPLGFSIKNGVKVPPYAQSTHMDHVHVAYALGAGNPAFFSNQKDAVSWEKKNIGPGIKSLTTNTAEIAGSKLQYGGNAPKTPKWMQLIEQDYQRNINKPINPGLIRNSGRGGLDMWEGPSGAYVSPDGMRPGAGAGAMASAPINITAPITINQQPGQSADELASIVAIKIGEAVADARAASIFV